MASPSSILAEKSHGQKSLAGYSPWDHKRIIQGFPDDSKDKESTCDAGYLSTIPGSRRSPGEVDGNPLQYSCLEDSMDRGAWQATVHGIAKSPTQLSN